jgi:sterol desaturase/sphingolipid hydroxylase (fatty acid hydroxylase superfamily)
VATDNRYHRIHHSPEPHHKDKNFAAFSSVWDLLFRTAYFPRPNEWPDTGLSDIGEPQRLSEFLWQPFRVAKHRATAAEQVGFRGTLVARPPPCNIAPDTEGNAT